MRRVALLALVLACTACETAKTSAVIELHSDFDEAIDDVEVEIRDARDARLLSQASFARASGPSFRMPFSFGVQPQASDDAFVVKATALASGRESVTAKLRVTYASGHTVRRTLFLHSACAGKSCGEGESCDPVVRGCRAVPDADSAAPAADGGKADLADASEPQQRPAADGGGAGGGATDTRSDADSAAASAAMQGGGGMSRAADGGRDAAGSGMPVGGGGSSAGAGAAGRVGSHAAGSGGARDGQGGARAGAPDVGGGTLSERQWASVMHAGRDYSVHSDLYGPGALTLEYRGTSFTVTSESGSDPGGIAAPSVFIGQVYNEGTPDRVLPVRVSDLHSMPIAFTHNGDRIDGSFRVLAAAWLSLSTSVDTGFASGGTLEVWPYAKPGQTPDGSIQASALSFADVPGSWDLWVGSYGGVPAIVYVRTEAVNAVQIDLKPFLDDAAKRPNAIQAAWYVASVSVGFDIYEGGTGLELDVANISPE